MKMKPSIIVLLCVLLCASQVDSLMCFTCERRNSNFACLKATRCAEEDRHCLTSVASIQLGFLTFGKTITKRCSPTCPEWDMNLGFASYSSSCCQTFLCNLFGHTTRKSGRR